MINDFSSEKKAALLEEVNNFKSLMMSAVTRELKTPLNTIMGLNTCVMDELGAKHAIVKKYLNPIYQ